MRTWTGKVVVELRWRIRDHPPVGHSVADGIVVVFWSGLILKYCLMKCPNVITTVDLMTDLLCEIDEIEKLSQTFILLQQIVATEGQKHRRDGYGFSWQMDWRSLATPSEAAQL